MRAYRTIVIVLILEFIILAPLLRAQTSNREPDINHRLEMIEKGQGEAVRAELPATVGPLDWKRA